LGSENIATQAGRVALAATSSGVRNRILALSGAQFVAPTKYAISAEFRRGCCGRRSKVQLD
jgi:hypothetical protein